MTGERGAGSREMTENAEGKSSVLMERRPAREDEGVAGKKNEKQRRGRGKW